MGLQLHPVFTPRDVRDMLPEELNYFTDVPVSHVVAFRDFERHIRIERAMKNSERAHSTRRPIVMDRNAAELFR